MDLEGAAAEGSEETGACCREPEWKESWDGGRRLRGLVTRFNVKAELVSSEGGN